MRKPWLAVNYAQPWLCREFRAKRIVRGTMRKAEPAVSYAHTRICRESCANLPLN